MKTLRDKGSAVKAAKEVNVAPEKLKFLRKWCSKTMAKVRGGQRDDAAVPTLEPESPTSAQNNKGAKNKGSKADNPQLKHW